MHRPDIWLNRQYGERFLSPSWTRQPRAVRYRANRMQRMFWLCVVVLLGEWLGASFSLAADIPDARKAWDNRYIITLKNDPLVASLGPRIEKQLQQRLAGTASTAAGKAMMSNARALVVAEGGEVRHLLPGLNAVAVRMSRTQLKALAQRSNIASIEIDPPRFPLMQGSQISPYGISLVQSDQVPYGGAPGIKVCVVDTGFDLGHQDLPAGTRVTGASAPGVGPWHQDQDGHGTHVAGSIMALGNNEGVIGATNGGEFAVHIYKVFSDESNTASTSDVIAGVQSCADAGARVVNLSLGCTGDECFSASEQSAFSTFSEAGILIIAAAGNDGTDPINGTLPSYPAAYPSVVAVGAVDENKTIANFSQRYKEVELAAPGVRVRSTIPRGTGFGAQVAAAFQNIASEAFLGSPTASAAGTLADCGLGGTTCTNVSGQICLIKRGTFLFAEKAQNCEAGGGIGAIIFNNISGPIGNGTLGDNPGITIPVAAVSDTAGTQLKSLLGQSAQVTVGPEDYGELSGTSMATPHVTGVAALVWSRLPDHTHLQIRAALQAGAEDLGTPGRDNSYGFGLVRALASVLELPGDTDNDGIENPADNCALTSNADQMDVDADGRGNLCDSDADGDGMSNDYEMANTLDPLVDDALADQDNDGFSNLSEFYASTSSNNADSTPQATGAPQLVAAVLPSSRSARVGQPVTVFATMINSSGETGINCSVAPLDALPSGYEFFTTELGTNAISGVANTTVNIAASSAQSFLLRMTPSAEILPREVKLRFGCDNLGSAAILDGLTTLLLSASSEPVADLIALTATSTNNGVVEANSSGAGAFSVASINLGAGAELTATVSGTNSNVPLALSICPTDLSGACLQKADGSITVTVAANAMPTFSVFVQATELITFDPAHTRVRVTFADASGAIRGATSVAVVRAVQY